MRKLGLAAVLALGLFGANANAGIMVEPFLAYEMSDYSASGGTERDVTGSHFGVRLAYTMLGAMVGAEYQTGSVSVEFPSGDADLDTTDIGLFVGYEFPILLRIYGTFYLSHEATPESSQDLEGDGGTKIGVSYMGLPFVALNFEMMSRSFDTQGSSTIDVETDGFMVGLGIPLP